MLSSEVNIPKRTNADNFLQIIDTFLGFQNRKTGDRSSLTLFDLFPGESISRDIIYDIVYYCAINTDSFGFKKEYSLFKESINHKTSEECREILRKKRELFFSKNANKNKIQPIISNIWDLAPHIMTLTKFYHPSEQLLGEKPKNLDEFVERFASENTKGLKDRVKIVRCSFAQTILATIRVLDTTVLDKADREIIEILKKIRGITNLTIQEEGAGYIKFIYRGHGVTYAGTFYYRIKTLLKIILKILYNREYADINDCGDLGGCRLVLERNLNPVLEMEERQHAASLFVPIIYSHKNEEALMRVKGDYLSPKEQESLTGKAKGKIQVRQGKNKTSTGNISNISFISSNESRKIEFQIESPGNMDAYFESADFNDVKKILASSSRDQKGINLYSLLLAISILCPPEYDKKTIVNHLLFTKKMIPGFKEGHSNTLFFMSSDIYTKQYKENYGKGIFEPISFIHDEATHGNYSTENSLKYSELCDLIDQSIHESKFKSILQNMQKYIYNAEQTLRNFSVASIIGN